MLPSIMRSPKHLISTDDFVTWINKPNDDTRTWTLKPGAPRHVVDAFPEIVAISLVPDVRPSKARRFDEDMPSSVDMANPSTLFVRIWQLAGNAGNLRDEAIAIGLDKPLASHLAAHAEELELLRDQVHDALLTGDDRTNGPISRVQNE